MTENEFTPLFRDRAPRFSPPADLEKRIRMRLQEEPAPAGSVFPWNAFWGAAGALAGMAAALAVGFGWGSHRAAVREFGRELVSDHLRAQDSGQLMAVASSDRHTVKPWLAAHLEFSPPVPDLAAEGFPLIGGRMDRVGGQAAAALVYQRRKHLITVYVWPADSAPPAARAELLGYAVLAWRDRDLDFAAVSDLPADELAGFAAQFKAAP